ncbi:MAG: AbrB/MazE/SpoVT family DNA-binding domain-containing protein [Acidobacteriaceae bacterium]
METSRVGKRGTIVVPIKLRQRFGLKEGDLLITEEREDGILFRPAIAVPVEIYTPERKAEFLLNNAVTKEDYDAACDAVRELGLDPAKVPHTDAGRRDSLPTNKEMKATWATIRKNLSGHKQSRNRNA